MKKIFKKALTNEIEWCIIGTSILFFSSTKIPTTLHLGKQARRSARCKLNFIKYLFILYINFGKHFYFVYLL